MGELPEYIDGLPNICGSEPLIAETVRAARERPVFFGDQVADPLAGIEAAFAIALHMHQPLIPAGGDDVRSARLISNLQYMYEHPDLEDNHNAPVFRWCYKRMGEFIPQLLEEGRQPRVMLEYSGTLLHGLRQMGADDVLEALRTITVDPRYSSAVEWLGCPWGHPVAPSTPVQDYRLHVRAWQHHFAALFGLEALGRVRGFSPSEMALPNHPDVAYEFVRTLTDCGYQWVLVQEHSVEEPDGSGPRHRYLPNRLTCTSSRGESASIIAVIKTQGSDTKLIGQMQPYYEARGMGRSTLAGRVSAAARHPDRRRRERRRDDERVPAQVLAGRPRVLELRDTDPQRHRLPRAPVRQRSPRGGAAHDTAAPAAPRLGADDAG